MSITLSDFFECMLALLGQREKPLSLGRGVRWRWHVLFYELKKSSPHPGKPPFFETLRFDWDRPYPLLHELGSCEGRGVIGALFSTGGVLLRSGTLEVYGLDPDLKKEWSHQLENLSAQQKEFLYKAVELEINGVHWTQLPTPTPNAAE